MTERQSAQMSKIKNGGLDQYGVEPCRQQQFGTAGIEGVRWNLSHVFIMPLRRTEMVFKVIRNPVTTTKFGVFQHSCFNWCMYTNVWMLYTLQQYNVESRVF